MKIEAGKQYKTRSDDIVYIVGHDAKVTRAVGYVIRRSYYVSTDDDNTMGTSSLLTFGLDGKFSYRVSEEDGGHSLDLVEEYKPPRIGQVRLYVFYSPTLGYCYRTTEVEDNRPYSEVLPDNAEIVCCNVIEWSEEKNVGKTEE